MKRIEKAIICHMGQQKLLAKYKFVASAVIELSGMAVHFVLYYISYIF